MREYQTRSYPVKFRAERAEESPGSMVVEGLFIPYGSETELWPGAYEEIARGAFDKSIAEDDIRALVDHDHRIVLGRKGAGTLELTVRNDGVWGKISINPDDQDAVNTYARVTRGDVTQASFAFTPRTGGEEVEYRKDDTVKWTVNDAVLYEVSIVTFPAYEDTSLQARRDALEAIQQRRLEDAKQRLRRRLEVLRGAETT